MMQFTYTLAIMTAYIAVSVAAQPPPEPPQMHAYIHGFPAQACQVSLYRWDNEGRAPFDLKAVIAAANKERDEPNRAAMINLEKILAGQEPPAPSKGRTQAPTTLPDGRGLLRGLSKYFH
ncbi:hypothetical protein MCOR20_005874 [Pyricularia oryzae]|nr:hypothetical protein MCOR20_005874 [Pyricularia oryzae]